MMVVASPYIAESIGKETFFMCLMMKDDLTVLNVQCMKQSLAWFLKFFSLMMVVASPYIAESTGKETVSVCIMMKDDLTVLASTLMFNV